MRRWFEAVVIAGSFSFVNAIPTNPWNVSTLRVVQVSSQLELRKWCGSNTDLYACTALRLRSLNAVCIPSEAWQWSIAASATFQPVTYLWDSRYLGHERLHLSDLEAATRDYVEQLRHHRYHSESDCRRAAIAEMAGFPRQLDAFAAASNALRH